MILETVERSTLYGKDNSIKKYCFMMGKRNVGNITKSVHCNEMGKTTLKSGCSGGGD